MTHHSRYDSSGRRIGTSQTPDNTYNSPQTVTPSVGFEPWIPASDRPQILALYCSAGGIALREESECTAFYQKSAGKSVDLAWKVRFIMCNSSPRTADLTTLRALLCWTDNYKHFVPSNLGYISPQYAIIVYITLTVASILHSFRRTRRGPDIPHGLYYIPTRLHW
jgi:hypothetical protein